MESTGSGKGELVKGGLMSEEMGELLRYMGPKQDVSFLGEVTENRSPSAHGKAQRR